MMSKTLTITVELGNDGMRTTADVMKGITGSFSSFARDTSLFDDLSEYDSGTVMDENGNTVGSWHVTPA